MENISHISVEMKFLIFFTGLAMAIACVVACNPDGTNEPKCEESNVAKLIRNFQNTKAFWWCKETGATAELINCPGKKVFHESSRGCIFPEYFKYTQPCSESCNPDGTNEPKCNKSNIAVPIRNFQNVKAFWWCTRAGTEAELLNCPEGKVFDETKRGCIFPEYLKYIQPCSENRTSDGTNEPQCDESNIAIPIRNFQNIKAFWLCQKAGAKPELINCPEKEVFDESTKLCISPEYNAQPVSGYCNPYGTNEPKCDESNVAISIRNFHNSKTFWMCNNAGAKAKLIDCPEDTIFDDSKKICVSPKDYIFTEPCSKICDPNGTNEPKCDESNIEKTFRNFQNNQTFWQCRKIGVKADLINCPGKQVFDEFKHKCISPEYFKYTQPCFEICNPNSANKPKCHGSNVEKPIRNFQNIKTFWWCAKAGAKAELKNCPDGTVFNESSKECVPLEHFKYSEPCSEAA